MADAGNQDSVSTQRWQLWPLLLALVHWSPDCGKTTFVGGQEALSNNMSCISFCSEALAATTPALATDDEVTNIAHFQDSIAWQSASMFSYMASLDHVMPKSLMKFLAAL